MAPDAIISAFWMISYKPDFSLSSFIFIKRLFSSSSLSAIRVVSSAYMRSLSPGNLDASLCFISLASHIMYSVCELNKQGDNIQPWCTPFPILNQFIVSCLILTVALWPAYRFLKRQVRWSGIPISFRIFHSLLWRRKWQPTPVFLPGESQRRRSLVGCRPWGRTELDTTDVT